MIEFIGKSRANYYPSSMIIFFLKFKFLHITQASARANTMKALNGRKNEKTYFPLMVPMSFQSTKNQVEHLIAMPSVSEMLERQSIVEFFWKV